MVRLLGAADVAGNFDGKRYLLLKIGIAKTLGLTTGIDGVNFHPN